MYEIIINYKNYKFSQLPISEYIFLQLLYFKDYEKANFIAIYDFVNLKKLEEELYIKITGENIEEVFPRQKCIDLFQSKEEKTVEYWIEDWIQLFPTGIKSGGYYIKSDKADCLKKMIKFLKTRKYTKDVIFQATKNYIAEKEKVNYAYIQQAHYFIEKDGVSTLATFCANVNVKEEDGEWTRNPVQ